MTKNLYFRAVVRRENIFKNFCYAIFLAFASYPRLLLEVFIRKNFGERYFRLSSVVTLTAILSVLPWLFKWMSGVTEQLTFADDGSSQNAAAAGPHYLTWHIFTGLFFVVGILRYMEMKRN